jgi:hypothetical protein
MFADDAENAPLDNQVPGGPIEGKSVVAVFAPLVINGQNSREATFAVESRVAALNTARMTPVFHEEDMHDGSAEDPRPSVNRNWLNVVIAYSHGRKYDGLSIMQQTFDQETRLQQYKFRVAMGIRLCQPSRSSLTSL